MVTVRYYDLPAVNTAEVDRYAGVRSPDAAIGAVRDECIDRCRSQFTGKVCFDRFALTFCENGIMVGGHRFSGRDLQKNLSGCRHAVLFAATVGLSIDRMIRRASLTDLAGLIWYQAIGTERIECLCDLFCADLKTVIPDVPFSAARPRFSPGYGDLPLSTQQDVFSLLDPMTHIGVTLTDSLLMTPQKSVTAFVGLFD